MSEDTAWVLLRFVFPISMFCLLVVMLAVWVETHEERRCEALGRKAFPHLSAAQVEFRCCYGAPRGEE